MAEYDPLEEAKRREAEKKAKKAAQDKAREERGKTSGRDQATQQQELSLTFVRLEQTQAKEQLDLAAQRYATSNSNTNKRAYDEAKAKYNKATAALRSAGVEVDPQTGQQKSTNPKYSDRPSNPVGRGFDPYTNVGSMGADNPAERAKSAATGLAPNYIPINPLDNNRWKDAFDIIPESNDIYWKQDASMVPISFFANSVGAIYQKEDASGSPETLNAAALRIVSQYADAGKMNDLRDALVTSGIAGSKDETEAMYLAKQDPNSAYDKLDINTRAMVIKAIQLGTKLNISAVSSGKKALTFDQFLKGNYSSYYAKDRSGGGGSGLPRRTVNVQKRVFTPEELELSIDAFFQEYTGQGASKEDLDFLVKKLNKQPAEKTVNIRKGNTVTSTTTGGVSQAEQQLMMREAALKDPAAESYNKATTYLNYFREALASPIELG